MLRLWIVFVFWGTTAAAQTPGVLTVPAPSATESRQPADPVLSASLAAHGGANLLAVRTIVLRGRSTIGTTSESLAITASLEGSSRVEYGNPVQHVVVTTPQGRSEISDEKTTVRPEHSGLYATLDIFSILGIQTAYVNGGNRGIVGDTTVNGRDALRVHAGTDNQRVIYGRVLKNEEDVDFDRQTGLVAAIHRRGYADDSLDLTFVTTYAFSDYREVAGIYLPFHIDRYLNGRLKESIVVDTFEINLVLDPDAFVR